MGKKTSKQSLSLDTIDLANNLVSNEILSKDEKKKQFGEVFTPPELVNEILDQLPATVWTDHTKTWLDNSCGDGAFLVAVKERLMRSLVTWEPNFKKRERHILDNMIYGVELQQDNWQRCRTRLGLTATGNDGNIVCTNALEYNYSFLKDDKGGYVTSDNTFDSLFS